MNDMWLSVVGFAEFLQRWYPNPFSWYVGIVATRSDTQVLQEELATQPLWSNNFLETLYKIIRNKEDSLSISLKFFEFLFNSS